MPAKHPRRVVLSALLALSSSACHAPPTTAPTPTPALKEQPTSPLRQASNKHEGDQLELTIPLFEGEEIELSALRGKVLLLEISPSWEHGWKPMHEAYARFAQEYSEQPFAVIEVILDPDTLAFEKEVETQKQGLSIIRGWDPMGALAAKLEVAQFPTYFVLDPQGRIVHIENSYDADLSQRLKNAIEKALAAHASHTAQEAGP